MKIARKKGLSPKKKIIIAVAVVAALAIGGAAFYLLSTQRNNDTSTDEPRPVNTVDYNPPTQEQEQETSTQKDEIIQDYTKNQDASTGSDGQNASSSIAVSITRANQTSAGISIGTVIDGTKNGTCNVTLSKPSQTTIQKTFTIVYEASSAYCQGAFISIDDIPASGEWQLSIVASGSNGTSEAATQTVNVDKP